MQPFITNLPFLFLVLFLTSIKTFSKEPIDSLAYQAALDFDLRDGEPELYYLQTQDGKETIKPLPFTQLNIPQIDQLNSYNGDPLYFYLSSDKSEVEIGEEVTLTIRIRRPNISPNSLFTFEELLDYKVKLLFPDGFILSKGSQSEFSGTFKNSREEIIEYKVQGTFEIYADSYSFLLIRGLPNSGDGSLFIKKASLDLSVKNKDIVSNNNRNFRTSNSCNITGTGFWGDLCPSLIRSDGENQMLSFRIPLNESFENCNIEIRKSGTSVAVPVRESYETNSLGNYYFINPLNHFPKIKEDYQIYINGSTNSSWFWGPFYHAPTKPSAEKLLAALNETVELSIDISKECETGVVEWFVNNVSYGAGTLTGSINSISITSSSPSSKSVYYTCHACIDPNSETEIVEFKDGGEFINISSDKTTICGNSTVNFQVSAGTNCTSGTYWKYNGGIIQGSSGDYIGNTLSNQTQSGSYQAFCNGSNLASNSIPITQSSQTPAPIVTAERQQIAIGDHTTVTASGCSGTLTWSGPGVDGQTTTSVIASSTGTYAAVCNGSCGLSEAGETNISIQGLVIRKSTESCIYDNEYITLTAEGCTNGYVEWTHDGVTYSGSSRSFPNPGGFIAKCYSNNGTEVSAASAVVCKRYPGAINITSDREFTSFSQPAYLTAHGCDNGTVEWNWTYGGNHTAFGTNLTATNAATYSAKCVNGSSHGPWATIRVLSEPANYVTFTSSKTSVKDGESLVLSMNGTCNGLVRFTLANGTQIFSHTADNQMVYGPGVYGIECIANDNSISDIYTKRIEVSLPGAPTISASRACSKGTEVVNLSVTGCDFKASWRKHETGEMKFGTSIDFFGAGTYYASCVSASGASGPESSVTIAVCPPDYPDLVLSSTSVAGGEFISLLAKCSDGSGAIWKFPSSPTYFARPDEPVQVNQPGTYEYYCGPNGPYIPVVIKQAPSSSLAIKSNKFTAAASEGVTLTATGCNYGTVKWKIGENFNEGNVINVTGPGTYEAWCEGDLLNDGNPKIIIIQPSGNLEPVVASGIPGRACPNEPITLSASCPQDYYAHWRTIKNGQEDYWYNNRNSIDNMGANYYQTYSIHYSQSITVNGPGIYWTRCSKWDGSYNGDFQRTAVVVEEAFPDYFEATNNSSVAGIAVCSSEEKTLLVGTSYLPGVTYSWSKGNTFLTTDITYSKEDAGADDAGIYTVTGTRNYAGGSCTATATTEVIYGLSPEVTSIGSNSPVAVFEDITLNVAATNADTYSWKGPAGFVSSDQNPVIPQASTGKGGIYTVTITSASSGCTSTATTEVLITGCDVKIVARDADGNERYELFKKFDGTYEPLSLKVESKDGSNLDGFNIIWTNESGTTIGSTNNISISETGTYFTSVTKTGSSCRANLNVTYENSETIITSGIKDANFVNGTPVRIYPVDFKNSRFTKILTQNAEYQINNSIQTNILNYQVGGVLKKDIIYLIPDKSYIEGGNFSSSTYSGYVFSFDYDSHQFKAGWKYNNGVYSGYSNLIVEETGTLNNCSEFKGIWLKPIVPTGDWVYYYTWEDAMQMCNGIILSHPSRLIPGQTIYSCLGFAEANDENYIQVEYSIPCIGGVSDYDPPSPYDKNNEPLGLDNLFLSRQGVNPDDSFSEAICEAGKTLTFPVWDENSTIQNCKQMELYERIFQNTLKENLPSSVHGAITSPADPDLFYRNQKNYSTPGNQKNLNYWEISACSFTQAYTDPSLSTAEKEELTSALTDLIENDHDIANEMFQTYTNLKQLVSPCSQGEEDRNCDAGGNLALTVLDALIGEGLDPNEELMILNNQIYMAESTMESLWDELGGINGTVPEARSIAGQPIIVNGKTVTFTPSNGDIEASLRFGDGECSQEIISVEEEIAQAPPAKYIVIGNIIYAQTSNGTRIKLSEYPLTTRKERLDVLRIMNVFGHPLGIPGLRMVPMDEVSSKTPAAYSSVDDWVNINRTDGIYEGMSNVNILTNILFHERKHQERGQALNSYLEHAEDYLKQMIDPVSLFESCPDYFKEIVIHSFGLRLLNHDKDRFDLNSTSSEINTALTAFNNGQTEYFMQWHSDIDNPEQAWMKVFKNGSEFRNINFRQLDGYDK